MRKRKKKINIVTLRRELIFIPSQNNRTVAFHYVVLVKFRMKQELTVCNWILNDGVKRLCRFELFFLDMKSEVHRAFVATNKNRLELQLEGTCLLWPGIRELSSRHYIREAIGVVDNSSRQPGNTSMPMLKRSLLELDTNLEICLYPLSASCYSPLHDR